jgi:N utilization substance protein B
VTRHAARTAAIEILYAADLRAADPSDVLGERPEAEPYTVHLVDAAAARREELDRLIGEHAVGWRPERMSAVDRNVLRVATLELLEGDVPPAAVIDEAVEIAKRFSGEEAGRFVNGVLAAVGSVLGRIPQDGGGSVEGSGAGDTGGGSATGSAKGSAKDSEGTVGRGGGSAGAEGGVDGNGSGAGGGAGGGVIGAGGAGGGG